MKLLVGIPLLLSAVSFVLSMLALFAGHREGFMEDYHVVMFNTSTLGQNFLQNLAGGGGGSSSSSSSATPTTTSAASTSTDGGILGGLSPGSIFSSIEATATALAGSVESEAAKILNDVGNDIADKLADELGIDQFYSLHVMDLCQGEFEPNATTPHATLNITDCSKPLDFSAMDISTLLDRQLSVGPFNITLSDLGLTPDMLGKLQDLPSVFKALAALYILSAIFTGLAVVGAAAALLLLPGAKRRCGLGLANLGVAVLAALFLLVGSLLYTVGAAEIVKKIRDLGADDIGLHVTVGTKFEALSWAAFALMAVAAGYWVYEVVGAVLARRRDRRVRGKGEKHSMESSPGRGGNGRKSRF